MARHRKSQSLICYEYNVTNISHRIPEAPLEVVLPDELQDSLRLLKPEGNLIKDRYRNMILRGKIESRKGAQRKQAKTTITEKWSYKDWTLEKAK